MEWRRTDSSVECCSISVSSLHVRFSSWKLNRDSTRKTWEILLLAELACKWSIKHAIYPSPRYDTYDDRSCKRDWELRVSEKKKKKSTAQDWAIGSEEWIFSIRAATYRRLFWNNTVKSEAGKPWTRWRSKIVGGSAERESQRVNENGIES